MKDPDPAKKTILIVGDEKGVRDLIVGYLSAEPYHLVEVDSARKALEFAEHITVDLLLTDAMLPNMKGRDLASRVCALQPAVKVLFVSGYSAEILINHGIFPPGAYSLGKPITEKVILSKVRSILREGQAWKEVSRIQ